MSGLLLRSSPRKPLPVESAKSLSRYGEGLQEFQLPGLEAQVSPLALGAQCSGQPYFPQPASMVFVAGWLLNREELSSSLSFREEDDDAVVVWRAFLRWGEEAWSELQGEFVIALFHEGTLRLVSDHFATRSLYWSSGNFGIAASTDISSLALSLDSAWDSTGIAHFLSFGRQLSSRRTEYEGIERLAPAQVLRWNEEGPLFRRYWTPPQARYETRDSRAQLEGFREVLGRALESRFRGQKLGCELSGGLDSTCLLSTAAELRPSSELRAFTTGFQAQSWDREPALAQHTAQALGVTHHQVWFEEEASRVLTLPNSPSSLVLNSLDSPWRAKFRAAQEFSPVLLCGDGGDPALGWSGWEDTQSHWTRQLWNGLQALALHFQVWGLSLRGFGLRRRFLSMGRPAVEKELPLWLNRDLLHGEQLGRVVQEEVEKFGEEGQRSGMTCSPFWGDLFRRRSPDATGCALHVSYPYFDLRVWSYLNTVVPVPWFRQKALSRLALRGRVREEIVQRPKATSQPFSSTSALLLRSHADWLEELWISHQDRLEPYLDKAQLFLSLRQLETLPFPQQYQLLAALRFLRWVDASSKETL